MADGETSDVLTLSAELQANLDALPGVDHRHEDHRAEELRRRISYFMAFRLGLIVLVTLLVVYSTWDREGPIESTGWLAWVTVGAGYVMTGAFAWYLRALGKAAHAHTRLSRFGWVQSGFDVLFAVIALGLTGGVQSDLAILILLAVFGAAIMGDRRQILTIALVSIGLYVGMGVAQSAGLITVLRPLGFGAELWQPLLRNTAAIVGVAILSSRLNTQLLSSTAQLGSLRTLNENIVRSLSSGLLTVDQAGQIRFANPTAATLLGQTGEIAGRDCEEVLPGLRAHLDDSGGLRNRFELTLTRPDDNRRVNLGLSCSPLLDERGLFLGHIVNFQDVTELREMERVLRRNERLAALGTLAASVAHEVRNPLAAISGCAELLDATVDEEDQRLVKVIRSESARLADIVTELLDYARPRKLERHAIELGRALVELADSFRADPSNAEINLKVVVPKTAVTVEVDIGQITQVLWNLVRNGAQAMDGSGDLELALIEVEDEIVLEVRDRGRGIEAQNVSRIFEPFYSTTSGGTGIGLALVQRIVDDHGGEIRVESTVGVGTKFSVQLPRRAPTLE